MKQPRQWNRWYYNNPVKTNLIILSLLVFLGTTIPSIVLISYYNTKMTYREIEKSVETASLQAGSQMTDMLRGVSKISTAILSDPGLHSLIQKDVAGRDSHEILSLESTLYTICSTSTNKLSAYVYDRNGVCYYTDSYRTKLLKASRMEESRDYQKVLARDGAAAVLFSDDLYEPQAGAAGVSLTGGLSLVRLINHPETLRTNGTLVLNVAAGDVISCFDSYAEPEGTYLITDRQGRILFTRNENEDFTAEWIIARAAAENRVITEYSYGYPCFIAANYLPDYDLILYACVPFRSQTLPMQLHLKFLLPIIAINVIVMILGLAIVARSLTAPLQQLAAHMGRVAEKDFRPLHTDYREPNELGLVANRFNDMTNEIERLIQKEVDIQKHKRHLELNLLQAQFKPHFLYNTIDMARALCLQGNVGGANQILKAMGTYYKNILSKGKTIIALEDEISTIRQYEFIRRFKDETGIMIEYQIADGTLRLPVLKFILQPLVENAIRHGLKHSDGGRILITSTLTDDILRLSVVDNGVGMPEEFSGDVISRSADPGKWQHGGSFGLRATAERLNLYYGDNCVITINSRADQGTEIIFELYHISQYIPEGWET